MPRGSSSSPEEGPSTGPLLRQVIDSALDAVIVIDEDSEVLEWNAAAEDVFGWPRSEVIGRSLVDLIIPEPHRAAHVRGMAHFLATGEGPVLNRRVDMTAIRRSGEEFPVELTICPVPNNGGWTFSAFLRDITDRVRAEAARREFDARLFHAQKLESLGVLAGGIAHDFNNLLMGIVGNASLALATVSPGSPGHTELVGIEKTARRLTELCKQMLAYSGRGAVVVRPLDIGALIAGMTPLLEVSVSKKARLEFELADGLPAVEGDASQLTQLLMNLIVNASEALEDRSGSIRIVTGVSDCPPEHLAATSAHEQLPPGRYVFIEVSDTGIGMQQDVLERVFEPFFTTKFAGRGLGMAAAQGIVRSHQGAIRVDSEPGSGTRVRILLPASEKSPSTIPAARDSSDAVGDRGKVMVVDDEPLVLDLVTEMLERAGLPVLKAANGQAALELAAKHQGELGLVLLDMTMPGISGAETFRELRRLSPELPVILSSGYNEQDATRHFVDCEQARFIQKPYRFSDLIDLVRQVLG